MLDNTVAVCDDRHTLNETTTERMKMFARARAAQLLKNHTGSMARWLGMHAGNHVFKDNEGRLWGVDLVVDSLTLYVGYAPKVTR